MNKMIIKGSAIVGLAATYYLYMFFIRVLPSVMTLELMQDLSVGSNGVGLISVAFLVSYASVQIPAGLMIDRYGARRIMLFGMLGCIIGSFAFQAANGIILPILARVLIGICCGAAFVAPMSLVKQWLPKHMFGTAAGMIQFIGCAGAMLSSPASTLVKTLGWRDASLTSTYLAIVLLILFFLFIKENNTNTEASEPSLPIYEAIYAVVSNKRYWQVALIAMTSWSIAGGFAEAWGIHYLSKLQGVSLTHATEQMFWMWIGIAVSSPLAGYWCEHTTNKALPIIFMYVISALALGVLLSGSITHMYLINGLLFTAGISAGGQPVAFSLISDYSPKQTLATAVSFCNVGVIAGGFAIQPLVNYLLSLADTQEYQLHDFQYCFSPIFVVLQLGIIASYKLPNTQA